MKRYYRLEENLETTFAADAMKQMGGYVKRSFGLSVKMRIENPKGRRKVGFVTEQGLPTKPGKTGPTLK